MGNFWRRHFSDSMGFGGDSLLYDLDSDSTRNTVFQDVITHNLALWSECGSIKLII